MSNKSYQGVTMNKKVIATSLLIAIFGVNSFAKDSSSTEDFFYQRGYENGIRTGYQKGVEDAFKEAKKMLARYGEQLQAYEIGKYLIKRQNLTYPQIWQQADESGVVKLRVVPSEIQREINVDELFAKFSTIPTLTLENDEKAVATLEETNSVYLNSRDSNANAMPQDVFQTSNQSQIQIKKSAKNLDILKKANVVFSDEGDFYNVLFFTQTEKNDFCEQFKICD